MRILVIGNMFESKSFLVDNFCEKDCEVAAENVTSRISGAAIVVSTIAVFFNLEPYLFSTAKEAPNFNELLKKLKKIGVNIDFIKLYQTESNQLLTIYNTKLERKCYSYTPNQIVAKNFSKFDFSKFDATFFCCIPFEQLNLIFEKNASISQTKSIILASGLTSHYFKDCKLKIHPDYIFMNKGEFFKVIKKPKENIPHIIYQYINNIHLENTILVITQGNEEVFIKDHNKVFSFPVEKVSNIVHPGGAGDAFAVGFISNILCGKNYKESCNAGHSAAKMMLAVNNIDELLEKML